jgi:ABC-type glycerol-3-phosphate transport system permease component
VELVRIASTTDVNIPVPRRRHAAQLLRVVLTHAPLVGLGLVMLTPLLWMVSTSFKADGAEFEYPPRLIPATLDLQNYERGLTILPFARYLLNSVIVTALATFGNMLSASFVAFGFARLRFPERDKLFILLLMTVMIPFQVTLIPTFILFKNLGWVNTYLPLTVPHFFGGGVFYIFLMRQFFMTIPYDLDEAARIDGASSFQIWWRILLPLSVPALGTVGVFSVLASWNDFLGPLIYMNRPEMRTMALGLQFFVGQYGTRWNQLMAVAVVTTIPVVVLFFFAQRFFMRGMEGAIK